MNAFEQTFTTAAQAVGWLYDHCALWAGLDEAAQAALYDSLDAHGEARLIAGNGQMLVARVAA